MPEDIKSVYLKLLALHGEKRASIKTKWNRCLPFAEELFDRWERAEFLGFGEKTSIYDASLVIGDVKVGGNTWIGPYTILDGSGGLEIGANCSISTGVQIYSHDSVKWALSGGKASYEWAPVRIGDCCYIGPETVVTKGVNIGAHSLIGAISLVNMDIPPNSIAYGVPAVVAGEVKIDSHGNIELDYCKQKDQ